MELPKRKKNRLSEYDYSAPNAYFITVCTDKRRNLFWSDVGAIIDRPQIAEEDVGAISDRPNILLTQLGKIVERSIESIHEYYPGVTVDKYVIMPNHIHLLLQIHTDSDGRSMIAPTISTVVRHMKGAVTKGAGFTVWQKGFYDHIVRNEKDYQDIWQYIEGNPSKWSEDELNV